MIIYMDLILFLNFVIDLIILMVVGIVLKRKKNLTRIILGAFIGSLSVLFLLIKLSNLELFIYKILLGFIMTYISFGYQNIKYVIKNFLYLYMVSIILGGFLYYLNIIIYLLDYLHNHFPPFHHQQTVAKGNRTE